MHISTRMKVVSLSSLMAEVCTPAATLCVWTRHPPPLARLRSLPGYYGYPAPIQRGAAAFACRSGSAAQVTVSSAREAALVRDGRLNVLYSLSAFSASLSRICFPSLSLSLSFSLSPKLHCLTWVPELSCRTLQWDCDTFILVSFVPCLKHLKPGWQRFRVGCWETWLSSNKHQQN